MRRITLALVALFVLALTVNPSEAAEKAAKEAGAKTAVKHHHRHHHHAKKAKCTNCGPDTGYRAAEWGSSVYHTNEKCPEVAKIAKEKLVTGVAATFGRKHAHCCNCAAKGA